MYPGCVADGDGVVPGAPVVPSGDGDGAALVPGRGGFVVPVVPVGDGVVSGGVVGAVLGGVVGAVLGGVVGVVLGGVVGVVLGGVVGVELGGVDGVELGGAAGTLVGADVGPAAPAVLEITGFASTNCDEPREPAAEAAASGCAVFTLGCTHPVTVTVSDVAGLCGDVVVCAAATMPNAPTAAATAAMLRFMTVPPICSHVTLGDERHVATHGHISANATPQRGSTARSQDGDQCGLDCVMLNQLPSPSCRIASMP
jgi:hypothetical protein